MFSQCQIAISNSTDAEMALQSEFIAPYSQLAGGASSLEFDRMLQANRNILLNTEASHFLYETPSVVSFKFPINVLGDTHIVLDEGLSHGARVELTIPRQVSEQLPAV